MLRCLRSLGLSLNDVRLTVLLNGHLMLCFKDRLSNILSEIFYAQGYHEDEYRGHADGTKLNRSFLHLVDVNS